MGFRNFLAVFPLCSEPVDTTDDGKDSLDASPLFGRLIRFKALFSRNPSIDGRSFLPFSIFGDDGDIGDIGEIGGVESAKGFFVDRNSLNV
jgi:hypothetical protein